MRQDGAMQPLSLSEGEGGEDGADSNDDKRRVVFFLLFFYVSCTDYHNDAIVRSQIQYASAAFLKIHVRFPQNPQFM
jgi:hypothetical protein